MEDHLFCSNLIILPRARNEPLLICIALVPKFTACPPLLIYSLKVKKCSCSFFPNPDACYLAQKQKLISERPYKCVIHQVVLKMTGCSSRVKKKKGKPKLRFSPSVKKNEIWATRNTKHIIGAEILASYCLFHCNKHAKRIGWKGKREVVCCLYIWFLYGREMWSLVRIITPLRAQNPR